MHTCSTSPCQPVSERCFVDFFRQIFLFSYFLLEFGALRHPKIIVQNEIKNFVNGSTGTSAKFQHLSPNNGVDIGAFVKTCEIRVVAFSYLVSV